jgi:hypothetical protein
LRSTLWTFGEFTPATSSADIRRPTNTGDVLFLFVSATAQDVLESGEAIFEELRY